MGHINDGGRFAELLLSSFKFIAASYESSLVNNIDPTLGPSSYLAHLLPGSRQWRGKPEGQYTAWLTMNGGYQRT